MQKSNMLTDCKAIMLKLLLQKTSQQQFSLTNTGAVKAYNQQALLQLLLQQLRAIVFRQFFRAKQRFLLMII
ncbi:hypothetical protein OUZ56_033260 [Daphnia magna]|uniref:Uncharacterized protein n=1 Tax=Daphnia magna TaxID=35525 RepID=A0ABQ9ZXJ8_9CRUS|nr:hypothetical protein OUZ56_033260 [Daphnia magna]